MQIDLVSPDEHRFSCYVAKPKFEAKAAILVIQEIFGVNEHIRAVCDRFANEGYLALAPALFDRIEPNIELGYSQEEMPKAFDLAFKQLKLEDALVDIQTAIEYLANGKKVGVVGYCFGGLLAWLAACELNKVSAVSSYYGGGIIRYNQCQPHCAVQLHFGKQDKVIPLSDVETIRSTHSDVEIFLYEAGHGFNCDKRPAFHAESSELAFTRTNALFKRYLLD